MGKPINFRVLAQKIAQEKGYIAILPVLEKELLHYEILAALDEARLLESLVFQGGTSLRLCYGSERMSEDLDFAGGKDFDGRQLSGIKEILENAINKRYDVDVTVHEPKLISLKQEVGVQPSVNVDCWQIKIVTQRGRPDIPQQKIKFEVATIPAHSRNVRPLISNYEELPYGYSSILIPVEEPEEIAADKLLALAVSPYKRYRDIWDLRWLSVRPRFSKARLGGLVGKKLEDYHMDENFKEKVKTLLAQLPSLVHEEAFLNLMRRFLATSIIEKTLEREIFRQHIAEAIEELYLLVLESL